MHLRESSRIMSPAGCLAHVQPQNWPFASDPTTTSGDHFKWLWTEDQKKCWSLWQHFQKLFLAESKTCIWLLVTVCFCTHAPKHQQRHPFVLWSEFFSIPKHIRCQPLFRTELHLRKGWMAGERLGSGIYYPSGGYWSQATEVWEDSEPFLLSGHACFK